jgi:hypothetical protein
LLEGRKFTFHINNKLLTTAINHSSVPWTARQTASGLVVPARHAKKSQNMSIDQNLGTRQEFTVVHYF